MACARGHKDYFAALERLPDDRLNLYEEEATQSIQRQHEIEAADDMSLEDYLANYFSQDACD
jgi:glutamate--cysteine ligase